MLLSILICHLLFSTSALGMTPKTSEYESTRIDWISPYFVLTYHHSKCSNQAQAAIGLILNNATRAASQKPPTVVHDEALSPDGSSRSYVSWAPYWWPDCCQQLKSSKGSPLAQPQIADDESWKRDTISSSSMPLPPPNADSAGELADNTAQKVINIPSTVDKTAEDTPLQAQVSIGEGPRIVKTDTTCYPQGYESDRTFIYKNCVYVRKDGVANPDVQLLPCSKSWVNMTSSVLSNALAYGLTRDEFFAQKAVGFIRAYFLDPMTGVNPHLNYGQIVRGPSGGGEKGQNDWSRGTFRGLIEWRHMVHVVNSIVILRACGSKAWSTLDATQMAKWANDYLHWLESSDIALRSRDNGNNMSSFYYNQVISLYILLGKTQEAANQANKYFTGPFMLQIDATGNQPLEGARTRPLHYLNFGLEAMIANAKLADSLGLNMWSAKTGNNTTIQDAADYILQMANEMAQSGGRGAETNDFADSAPHIAAVLTAYGDRQDGRYQAYLSNDSMTADSQEKRTWRLYNLPCSFYSSPSKGHTVSSQKFQ